MVQLLLGWLSDGGNSSAVSHQLSTNVIQIFSNESAFAALKNDGSVVTWGDQFGGGDSSEVSDLLMWCKQNFSTGNSFAAIKDDGSVVNWGGGDISNVSDSIIFAELHKVNFYATIVCWYWRYFHSKLDIFFKQRCFCSLKGGWIRYYLGRITGGKGNVFVTPRSYSSTFDVSHIDHDLEDIFQINSTKHAFAALKEVDLLLGGTLLLEDIALMFLISFLQMLFRFFQMKVLLQH